MLPELYYLTLLTTNLQAFLQVLMKKKKISALWRHQSERREQKIHTAVTGAGQ